MKMLSQLLGEASLAQAQVNLENDIKAQPANADLRAALVQLLCLNGNWSRARAQLKSWLALAPQAAPTVTLLEQALSAEALREKTLAGQERPMMPEAHWPWLTLMADALSQPVPHAALLRAQALEQASANPGELTQGDDSTPFSWLMDGDARFGPVCEALVNGRYYWLPFSAIAQMTFQPPDSVFDLIWRHTHIRLHDGSEQVCQIPLRYPVQSSQADSLLLARATEWQALPDGDSQYLGFGQKVWMDEHGEYPLLTLKSLSFQAQAHDE